MARVTRQGSELAEPVIAAGGRAPRLRSTAPAERAVRRFRRLRHLVAEMLELRRDVTALPLVLVQQFLFLLVKLNLGGSERYYSLCFVKL